MNRRILVLLALLTCLVPGQLARASAVTGWGLGATGLSPPGNTPINIVAIGDSIAADYEGTNPPVYGQKYPPPLILSTLSGFAYEGAYLLQQTGYTDVTFTSWAITGTSIWEWLHRSGSFVIPTPVMGAKNIALFEVGTNDSILYSTAGGFAWQQITTYTPIAYVLGSVSGTSYIFRTTTGGVSQAGSAPFNAGSLTGPTTDGTVTWTLSSTTQLLTDIEANYLTLTNAYAAAGWIVVAAPWLPLCSASDIRLPQTITNRDAMRVSFGSFIESESGTNGITTVQHWENDTAMSIPGYPTACNASTSLCAGVNCFNVDGVHPSDQGHLRLGTMWTFPALQTAL